MDQQCSQPYLSPSNPQSAFHSDLFPSSLTLWTWRGIKREQALHPPAGWVVVLSFWLPEWEHKEEVARENLSMVPGAYMTHQCNSQQGWHLICQMSLWGETSVVVFKPAGVKGFQLWQHHQRTSFSLQPVFHTVAVSYGWDIWNYNRGSYSVSKGSFSRNYFNFPKHSVFIHGPINTTHSQFTHSRLQLAPCTSLFRKHESHHCRWRCTFKP